MFTESLTQQNQECRARAIRLSQGVENVEAFLSADLPVTVNAGAWTVLDMGAESVGGYPVFRVVGYTGEPVVRISYSDRMEPYRKSESMGKGDFVRGSCTYLGVELPVMPANPDRFETYTVNRTGEYLFPLIQGQQRFIYITVEGTDSSVTFSDFLIEDRGDRAELHGSFESDDPRADRIWMASARTLRLATVEADLWEVVRGRLCLRNLTMARQTALFDGGFGLRSLEFDCDFELASNPVYPSGIGAAFFCPDRDNGYVVYLSQDETVRLCVKREGKERQIRCERLGKLTDNRQYRLKIAAGGGKIRVELDGTCVLTAEDTSFEQGSFGFSQRPETRAMVTRWEVSNEGREVYRFAGGLDDFDFERTGRFVSDGAKRDRLPWSGDLDWAFDSGWYSFGPELKAMNTLKILFRHQNPEGFVFGTCYPENSVPPESCEYGYYQSDMFSVWNVISALVYEFLSGDERVQELYPAMKRCMDYFPRYIDSDGLFDQRYETSKGLWDHCLGDTGKNTYTNLMICDAYERLADYASRIGEKEDAARFSASGAALREAIFRELYDPRLGGFVKRKDWRELCDMANPYAMGKHMVNAEQASAIAAQAEKITHPYGKVAILMIRGLYDYGYADRAQGLLFGKLPLELHGGFYANVDWMTIVDNPDYPETVYECMHNPPFNFGDNLNWGDLAHPDSGVAGVYSSRIAGVMPLEPGFKRTMIRPHPGEMKRIACEVPTKYGSIRVKISCGKNCEVIVEAPAEIEIETDFSDMPSGTRVLVRKS